ncbi:MULTISPECIES: hypothetical protein [unclassified Mesorhizobium]|uniref:hypothetical protein n=1 Tax=unclassified Mesorhizobium TaxID=325217 RepID=UPI00095BF53A|nr:MULTISPECIES: hypothetical protein [unclassified Mesorhizobium]MBN9255825.1 hypothetical protein [Mesorhizobium sp.]OJX71442.1 MAG: hypothetical protein BGO93_08460 [Mesorhizobium sp. 65-26]
MFLKAFNHLLCGDSALPEEIRIERLIEICSALVDMAKPFVALLGRHARPADRLHLRRHEVANRSLGEPVETAGHGVPLETLLDDADCLSVPRKRRIHVPVLQPGGQVVGQRNARAELLVLAPAGRVEVEQLLGEVDLGIDAQVDDRLGPRPGIERHDHEAEEVLFPRIDRIYEPAEFLEARRPLSGPRLWQAQILGDGRSLVDDVRRAVQQLHLPLVAQPVKDDRQALREAEGGRDHRQVPRDR